MFYYYGRKKKIVKKYPEPIYDTVIEPFAGAAAYSMEYWTKNVILVEKNARIVAMWKFLQSANQNDILGLPILSKGETLDDEKFNSLSANEKAVIGLFLNPGSALPKKRPGTFNLWTEKNRERLSSDISKVAHWDIRCGDYTEVRNVRATWFIDPPYQFGGQHYTFSNKKIDYEKLKEWCKIRKGQVIVCENTKATWLDFTPLVALHGQKHTTTEAIRYRENNN